jgi:hypothetical protein
MMPIVDVSDTTMAASGTTKRISINNILACSPSATLASATITGAATVGTTLGVTGVSTFAAGTALLPALTTTGDTNTGIYYPAADTFAVTTGGTERYRVDSSGNLGVGVVPTYKFQSVGIAAATSSTFNGSGGNLIGALINSDDANSGANPGLDLRRWTGTANNHGTSYIATNSAGETLFYNGAVGSNTRATSLKMTLDASGRLILLASTTTPATLATNGELTMTATSDTNLRFSYRGSDGTTRVANLTLA